VSKEGKRGSSDSRNEMEARRRKEKVCKEAKKIISQ
jgi:hypothetical protein